MDELEAVGDPELRSALLYARSRDRPVTADELAGAQSVHRNVARSRLERLVAARLLEPGYERRSGRAGPGAGRPAKTYTVVPSVEQIEFPPRRFETLLGLLVSALPDATRARMLRDVGEAFGRELAATARLGRFRSPQRAIAAVCRASASLGYQATLERVDGQTAVITTPTCPVRPLVRTHEDAAEIDRGMWAGLVDHALGGKSAARVECHTAGCLEGGICRISIRL
jgi:predicted ArsR family transcriptional regulator